MTPVFECLPHDIFRNIMQYTYVHTLGPLSEEAEFDIEVISPPITASQVCRSWRYVLLSDSTMWTCIIIPKMGTEWIVELLRPSDSSLLNVFLVIEQDMTRRMSYNGTSSALSALFDQLYRFRMLRVQINFWDLRPPTSPPDFLHALLQQILSYLQRPAPMLQTFSFWYRNLDHGPDYTVIEKLFSHDAPNLKQIHHRLSPNFVELHCPVFHGLSELRLTLESVLNSDSFLNLLASSPSLKLLHLFDEWYGPTPYSQPPSDRKVSLPLLEKLLLEVNCMVDLADFVLTHVTVPLNVKWHLSFRCRPGYEESPLVSQFLSRAQFTSLHIRADPASAHLIFEEKPDGNHVNRFIYFYEYLEDLEDVWDRIITMHAFQPSRITHMELGVGRLSSPYDTISTYLASMPNLQSLVIRPDTKILNFSGGDKIRLLGLIALIPKEVLDLNSNRTTTQNIVPTVSEDTPACDSDPSPFTEPMWPCPLLREVTWELRDQLENTYAGILCECSDARRDAGYPLQIHVRCPRMQPDVEEMLGVLKTKSIKISISSLQMTVHPYNVFSPYGLISDI